MTPVDALDTLLLLGLTEEAERARALIVEPVGYTEMSAIDSINIDSDLDLMLAELVAARDGL